MPRSRRRPQIRASVSIALVAALALVWTGSVADVPAAVAAQAEPAGGERAALTAQPDVERRERVRTRGRVDVERAAAEGGASRQVEAVDPVAPSTDALGTSAAAPPDDATSSGARSADDRHSCRS